MKKFLLFCVLLISATAYYFYPEKKLPRDARIDRIVVRKGDRAMDVFADGKLVKTYVIVLGGNAVGDKEYQGDKKTPEGVYFINAKNDKSAYHKNLGISYPNDSDVSAAKSKKLDPGGDIKIHGIRNGLGFIGKFQRWYDWTAGCVAVTNDEIDELYEGVEVGTPIEIVP